MSLALTSLWSSLVIGLGLVALIGLLLLPETFCVVCRELLVVLGYLVSFFRNALLESFQKLQFGLEFFEFRNPKKIPRICRENRAILEKLLDSANS